MQFPVSASRSLPGWPCPPWKRSTAVQRVSYIGTGCRPGERSARLLVRHQSHRQGFQHPAVPSGLSGSGTVCWSLWKPRTETVPAGSAGPPAAIWQSAHRGSDDAGQGLGNRRLLGNNKFHSCILLLLKMGKRIAHPGVIRMRYVKRCRSLFHWLAGIGFLGTVMEVLLCQPFFLFRGFWNIEERARAGFLICQLLLLKISKALFIYYRDFAFVLHHFYLILLHPGSFHRTSP